jgi:excisionase family DNA binding protein
MNRVTRISGVIVEARYLTLKQAAAYLSLSPKSLYRLVDAHRIPFTAISVSHRHAGGPERVHYRFDRQALDAFMAHNAVFPPQYRGATRGLSSK